MEVQSSRSSAFLKQLEAKDIEGWKRRLREKGDPGKELENKDKVEEVPWKLQQIFTYIGSRYSQETFRPSDTPTGYYCSFCDFSATLLPIWYPHQLSIEHRTNIQNKSSTLDCNVCGIRLIFNATTQAFFLNCQAHQKADFQLKLTAKIKNYPFVPSKEYLNYCLIKKPLVGHTCCGCCRDYKQPEVVNPVIPFPDYQTFSPHQLSQEITIDQINNSIGTITVFVVNKTEVIKLGLLKEVTRSISSEKWISNYSLPNIFACIPCRGKIDYTFHDFVWHIIKSHTEGSDPLYIFLCQPCQILALDFDSERAYKHLRRKGHELLSQSLEEESGFKTVEGCSYEEVSSKLIYLVKSHLSLENIKIICLICPAVFREHSVGHFTSHEHDSKAAGYLKIFYKFYLCCRSFIVTDKLQKHLCSGPVGRSSSLLSEEESASQCEIENQSLTSEGPSSELVSLSVSREGSEINSSNKSSTDENHNALNKESDLKLEPSSDFNESVPEVLECNYQDKNVPQNLPVISRLVGSCLDHIALKLKGIQCDRLVSCLTCELSMPTPVQHLTGKKHIKKVADCLELYYTFCSYCDILALSHLEFLVREHIDECALKSSKEEELACVSFLEPCGDSQFIKLKAKTVEGLVPLILDNFYTESFPEHVTNQRLTCLPCQMTVRKGKTLELHFLGKEHIEQVAHCSELCYTFCSKCDRLTASHSESMVREHIAQCPMKNVTKQKSEILSRPQPTSENFPAPIAFGQFVIYKFKGRSFEHLTEILFETLQTVLSHLPVAEKVVTCLSCQVTVTGDVPPRDHFLGGRHTEQVPDFSELYYMVCPYCSVFIVSHLDSMVGDHISQCFETNSVKPISENLRRVQPAAENFPAPDASSQLVVGKLKGQNSRHLTKLLLETLGTAFSHLPTVEKVVKCLPCLVTVTGNVTPKQHFVGGPHAKQVANFSELYYIVCPFCNIFILSYSDSMLREHVNQCSKKNSVKPKSKTLSRPKSATENFTAPNVSDKFVIYKLKDKNIECLNTRLLETINLATSHLPSAQKVVTCLSCLVTVTGNAPTKQHFFGTRHSEQVANGSEVYYIVCPYCYVIIVSHSDSSVKGHIDQCSTRKSVKCKSGILNGEQPVAEKFASSQVSNQLVVNKIKTKSTDNLKTKLIRTINSVFNLLPPAQKVVTCLSCLVTVTGDTDCEHHFFGKRHSEQVANLSELYYIVCPKCNVFIVSHSDSMVREHVEQCKKKSVKCKSGISIGAQPAAEKFAASQVSNQLVVNKIKSKSTDNLKSKLIGTINSLFYLLPPAQKVVTCLSCLVTVTGDVNRDWHFFGKRHSEQVANLSELYYIVCPKCNVFIVSHSDSMVRDHVDQCSKKEVMKPQNVENNAMEQKLNSNIFSDHKLAIIADLTYAFSTLPAAQRILSCLSCIVSVTDDTSLKVHLLGKKHSQHSELHYIFCTYCNIFVLSHLELLVREHFDQCTTINIPERNGAFKDLIIIGNSVENLPDKIIEKLQAAFNKIPEIQQVLCLCCQANFQGIVPFFQHMVFSKQHAQQLANCSELHYVFCRGCNSFLISHQKLLFQSHFDKCGATQREQSNNFKKASEKPIPDLKELNYKQNRDVAFGEILKVLLDIRDDANRFKLGTDIKLKCFDCSLQIPFNPRSIDQHFKGSNHKMEHIFIGETNFSSFYCASCKSYILNWGNIYINEHKC